MSKICVKTTWIQNPGHMATFSLQTQPSGWKFCVPGSRSAPCFLSASALALQFFIANRGMWCNGPHRMDRAQPWTTFVQPVKRSRLPVTAVPWTAPHTATDDGVRSREQAFQPNHKIHHAWHGCFLFSMMINKKDGIKYKLHPLHQRARRTYVCKTTFTTTLAQAGI